MVLTLEKNQLIIKLIFFLNLILLRPDFSNIMNSPKKLFVVYVYSINELLNKIVSVF